MKKRVAIVDICWTLFYSNTTFDFVDFVVRSRRYRCWRTMSRCWLVRKFNSFLYRFFSVDLLRKITLRFLAGYSREKLLGFAEKFYSDFLEPRKIEPIWQRLSQFDELILASGTLDVVAQIVAKKMSAKRFASSQLAYENNICLGRLAKDFLNVKSEILSEFSNQEFSVVTDNLSDYQLVNNSTNAIVLVYDNENRWRKLLGDTAKIDFVYAHESARY